MSSRIIRRSHHPHDFLERILSKTTLTTQRVGHSHIVDLGGEMMITKADDSKERRERELQEALDAAEARATRELRAALKRCIREKDQEKYYALQQQQGYYERLAKRIEEQRDRAEEERMRELTKKMEGEKKEALEKQLAQCEKIKEQAIEDACTALTKVLEARFAIERANAIEEALDDAWKKYQKRERDVINRTKKECQNQARLEAERVEKLHQQELDKLNTIFRNLEKKYHNEINEKKKLLRDFRALQDDYKRFLDYSDGKYHSDYLMHIRHIGSHWTEKHVPEDVVFEDIFDL